MGNQWNDKIFRITAADFDSLAIEIFHFQYGHNPIYKAYCDALKMNPKEVTKLIDIPFLPVGFFKTHEIKTTEFEPQIIFESSGTTQSVTSRHFLRAVDLYIESFTKCFESFYGSTDGWCIIALLPSYLERANSSLVFMVNTLIEHSTHPRSSFYLADFSKLYDTLQELERAKQKTLLIGVSFALLDFAERYSLQLRHTVVMETGGMKGKRKEIVRAELHSTIREKFGVSVVHSEYGMTEMLSQAYAQRDGIFHHPRWMKVLIRDEEDPWQIDTVETLTPHDTRLLATRGIINIIDLANVYSCSFIATDDAGILHLDGSFEVIGRVDNSDVRGCSLMAM